MAATFGLFPANFRFSGALISPPTLVKVQTQFIILKYGILRLNSFVLPSSNGYISQSTPYWAYGLMVNEVNEGIIRIINIKNVLSSFGICLGNSLRRRALFDYVSLVSS